MQLGLRRMPANEPQRRQAVDVIAEAAEVDDENAPRLGEAATGFERRDHAEAQASTRCATASGAISAMHSQGSPR